MTENSILYCLVLAAFAIASAASNPCLGLDGVFVNSDQSCAGYYWCSNGNPHFAQCPDGHYFSEEKQICDYSKNVDCGIADGIVCPSEGVSALRHPLNCKMFFICFSGVPVESTCAPGLHFDQAAQNCNTPEQANCIIDACPLVNDPNNIVTIPSGVNCSSYFICIDQRTVLMNCAGGLYWDQPNQRCDIPANVVCEIDGGDNGGEDGGGDSGENGGGDVVVACPETGFVIFPHPTDCSLFFVCMDGSYSEQQCVPGLLFDTAINKCNLEANVICPTSNA